MVMMVHEPMIEDQLNALQNMGWFYIAVIFNGCVLIVA